MAKIINGVARLERDPRPPKDPHPVLWPVTKSVTPEVSAKFAAALMEVLAERKLNHMSLAERMNGKDENGKPRSYGSVRGWCRGESVPRKRTAEFLAEVLNVPLSRLLSPKGPYSAAARANGKGNGKGNGHAAPLPPPLPPLPEGTPPVSFEMHSHPEIAGFTYLKVDGLVHDSTAQSVMSLIRPDPS